MNLTLRLAHDERSSNRCSALKILNEFAQDMGQTLTECFIAPEVSSLGLDEDKNVRIEVARNLVKISRIVSLDFYHNKIFCLYQSLTADKEERVRKACAEQIAEMAKISNGEVLGQKLSDIFFGFLKDPSSKLVRGTAFQKIGPFVGAFKNGANIDDKIIQFYITTIANSKNKDVCYHASFNFPAFIYVFGPENWPRF